MDLQRLRYFVAVVEEGSIHGGARRLMISQPPLSQAMRQLEREVGTPLLVRSPRGIEATPAGEILLEHAHEILRRVGRAVNLARQAGESERTIQLGLVGGAAAASELTWPIVSAFRKNFPDLRFRVRELSFVDQVDALVDGEVDLALARPPYADDRIELLPLFEEPRLLCVSANHPLAGATDVHVTDILDEPMVDVVNAPREWRHFWHLNEERNGEPPAFVPGHSAINISEWVAALINLPIIMDVAAGAWRIGMATPALRVAPLHGAAPTQIAVSYRRGEKRRDVLRLAECARSVTEDLICLVPDGRLVDAGAPTN